MEAKDLLIRCSSLGKVMTNSRSKDRSLSATASGYIKELFLDFEYGIRKEFWSRYTDKGIMQEKESIRLANKILGWGLTDDYIENGGQESFRNDYIMGRTDVCNDYLLADVKTSWDGTTFPWFLDKKPPKDYVYQLQGYMWLSGHERAELVYCLVNTPFELLQDEIRREHWKHKSNWNGDEDPEIVEFVTRKHTFDHIPEEKRVKRYVIERDEEIIEKIKLRVGECRIEYQRLKDMNEVHPINV